MKPHTVVEVMYSYADLNEYIYIKLNATSLCCPSLKT